MKQTAIARQLACRCPVVILSLFISQPHWSGPSVSQRLAAYQAYVSSRSSSVYNMQWVVIDRKKSLSFSAGERRNFRLCHNMFDRNNRRGKCKPEINAGDRGATN